MTQPSPRSPQCLVRPAQVGDRHAITRLLHQFYQSLQLPHTTRLYPVSQQVLWAIALVVGALIMMLALHGFCSRALALSILLVLVLKNYGQRSRTLTHLWVADCGGEIIGCAKLLRYNTHSEAYLVCVDAAWRNQGYGSQLVQRLTQEATLPLYLASQPHRMRFYRRLGFVPVSTESLPVAIRSRLGVDRYQDYGIVAMVFGR